MIVDTDSGEIIDRIDLSPLKRKPRGRVSRPQRSYRRNKKEDALSAFLWALGMTSACLCLLATSL